MHVPQRIYPDGGSEYHYYHDCTCMVVLDSVFVLDTATNVIPH